jgi:hypothetical protein
MCELLSQQPASPPSESCILLRRNKALSRVYWEQCNTSNRCDHPYRRSSARPCERTLNCRPPSGATLPFGPERTVCAEMQTCRQTNSLNVRRPRGVVVLFSNSGGSAVAPRGAPGDRGRVAQPFGFRPHGWSYRQPPCRHQFLAKVRHPACTAVGPSERRGSHGQLQYASQLDLDRGGHHCAAYHHLVGGIYQPTAPQPDAS